MEYIVINESKLKIICESRDLSQYGICADSLEYSDASSRKFLEELLEEAKLKFGFETSKHRVLIQLFPDNNGGCEIFVSKLGLLKNNTEKEEKKEYHFNKSKSEPIKKLFLFEKLDFLLEACKRLSFLPLIKKSEVFYLTNKGYYLYFEIDSEDELEEYGVISLNEYSFLHEYGESQNADKEIPYLAEYAKSICKTNAVEILGKI